MKKAPKYISFRIFISSALLYFFLVIPFAGFMWVQKIPDLLRLETGMSLSQADSVLSIKIGQQETRRQNTVQEYDTPDVLITDLFENISPDKKEDLEIKSTSHISTSFDYLLNAFLVILVLLGLLSAPFKRFFRRRKKQLFIAQRLENHCRKWLLKTPVIHAILFAIPHAISLSYTAWTIYSGVISRMPKSLKLVTLKAM